MFGAVGVVVAPDRNGSGDLSAGAPLEHHHRQPCFFFEFRIGQMIVVSDGARIDFPEDALPGVLGQQLEPIESQRRDTSGH